MKVFPPSAIANLLAANRDTTRVLFRLGRSLADWCSDHILDLSQPLQLRWSLLQFKSDGRTPTAMRGYISAVSSVHGQVMNNGVHGPASKHKSCFHKGEGISPPSGSLSLRRPSVEFRSCFTRVDKISLRAFRDYQPHISYETVFLTALISAKRASEIHPLDARSIIAATEYVARQTHISFAQKCRDWPNNQPIIFPTLHGNYGPITLANCVRRVLLLYLRDTECFRPKFSEPSQLF